MKKLARWRDKYFLRMRPLLIMMATIILLGVIVEAIFPNDTTLRSYIFTILGGAFIVVWFIFSYYVIFYLTPWGRRLTNKD
ncbi:hypothetical protein [Evansella cellulosilytica]|uniref:Uncharacterized protein n=1 Tax=Evansella cellulosilytica (strain ATCC 21833 / DSM 2522 / FERM P-1141 / JCM 9156 / N-4) TaxID=649639 RepID=E6TWP5_EVAC2|nr:hypothetical protein [Evansella cellulosilytica]ADU28728.1 hypothetical protein Bcell_0446 [Evansella cellulosilytica DSM 2522]